MAKDLDEVKKGTEGTKGTLKKKVSEEARDNAYASNRGHKHHKKTLMRLKPRILYREVCKYLEQALEKDKGVNERSGYRDAQAIWDYIVAYQDKTVDPKLKDSYTTLYNVNDIIKGINKTIQEQNCRIADKKFDGVTFYKGYKGLKEDYDKCNMNKNASPVEKDVYAFIKGTMNFDLMASIRNQMNMIAENEWIDYLALNPKAIANKKAQADYKAQFKPKEPFICIESSKYEFTEEYEDRIKKQRKIFKDIADAIIQERAVRVTYQAHHYNQPDELEFSPHYIREVRGKLMVYGQSRSIKYHAKDQYTIVNLVVDRIEDVNEFDDTENVKYYSAAELGLDYNKTLFYNRMTFDMPGFPGMTDVCTRVLLKVRKEVQTPGKPKMPYKRIIAEPLHHSQVALTELEEDEFGYISIFITDYMFIKPLLLPYGSDIAVVEPKELLDEMAKEIKKMAAMYGLQLEEKTEKGGQTMTASQS